MTRFFATAATCLLAALLMPPLTASAGPVLTPLNGISPACQEDLLSETYPAPVAAYAIRNVMFHNTEPHKIKFNLEESGSFNYFTEFRPVADKQMQNQLEGYLNEGTDIYAVFVPPSSVQDMQTRNSASYVDFFLVASMNIGHGSPPMCVFLTDPFGIGLQDYNAVPPEVRQVMDMRKNAESVNVARAPTVYRDFTSQKMVDACGAGFITEYLHPDTIGYRVTQGESGIGTGQFHFTVEGGVEGIDYAIDENGLTVAVKSMLNVLGKLAATLPEDKQREKLFAVFGPPEMNEQGGNVSIMLVKSDTFPAKSCMLMTGLQTTFLLPEHMPEKVRQERTRPEASHSYISMNY